MEATIQQSQVQLPPPEPQNLAECSLDESFVKDLILKTVYYGHRPTGRGIADTICLPFAVIGGLLQALRVEQMVEVVGSPNGLEQAFRYAITPKGRERALQALEQCQYVGPAPVTLEDYRRTVVAQSVLHALADRASVEQGLSHLVMSKGLMQDIGVAVNRCRSLFLWGNPGNGKTGIAEAIARILPGKVYVPYAVICDHEIIKVYDVTAHTTQVQIQRAVGEQNYDRRWVPCQRPYVAVGGEMQFASLDLVWDDVSKFYEAPLQMKANGGVFVIDDFGRQPVRPRELLNRWIVPLEKRVDYLNLHSGKKIEVPFDVFIVFSTNLEPADLCEEAFLRRIANKVYVPDPTPEQFAEIFRRVCSARGVPFSAEGLKYLYANYYLDGSTPKLKRALRGCHPRDIIDQITSIAKYRGMEPRIEPSLIDLACRAIFLDLLQAGKPIPL
jgi:MoxR-like ATPase